MNVALYARYSSDNQRDASIADQLEHRFGALMAILSASEPKAQGSQTKGPAPGRFGLSPSSAQAKTNASASMSHCDNTGSPKLWPAVAHQIGTFLAGLSYRPRPRAWPTS